MPQRRKLVWSDRSGRYRDAATGRYVNAATVRRDLDTALEQSARTVAGLAEDLRAQRIGLIEWELAMRAEIRTVQLYSAATAVGGVAQLSPAQLGRVGAAVREQFKYLDRFAREIEAGLPLDGRFTVRSRLYAAAGRPVYHKTERTEKLRRGYTEEKSLLHPADHCDLCVSEAEAGWRPIGEMIPIGERTCRGNDRCSVTYRKPSAA